MADGEEGVEGVWRGRVGVVRGEGRIGNEMK